MTSYAGGKKRIGKEIHDVIIEIEQFITNGKKLPLFVPMIGMAGVTIHFAKDNDRDIYACDINSDIVKMWVELQNGWNPPKSCNKKTYEKLKKITEPSPERGFLGSACSFNGIFFGLYKGKYTKNKNFVSVGRQNLLEYNKYMKNVKFCNPASYDTFEPKNMLIYVDPPYLNNGISSRNKFFKFDHGKFWDVMRKWSKNNIVLVSERVAPDDFIPIWCKDYSASVGQGRGHVIKHQEYLFLFNLYKL